MSRNHFTADQRSEHLLAWKKSGQSQLEYCKQQGIKYLTFNKWIYKSRGINSIAKLKISASPKKFIPIHVTESPGISAPLRTIVEIEFPDGTKLRIN